MNNPLGSYSIELYIGEKRSGKTLSMVAETYEDLKKLSGNLKIYANLHLNRKYFPDYKYVTIDEIENFFDKEEKFSHAVFLLDEIHIMLDSRKFMNKGNQKIGYFLGQMGKRGNVLRGTTHFPELIDFRLRAYCERWVYIKKGLLIRNNFITIKNYNRVLSEKENNILYIKNDSQIRKLEGYSFIYHQEKPLYIKANDHFDMYDTEELIKPKEEKKKDK